MNHLLPFLVVILCYLSFQSIVEAKIGGFTIDLIHRDSKLSPFYNHSATPGDLYRKAALRSIARANHFLSFNSIDGNKIESGLTPSDGEHLLKLSVGNPPVEVLAIADTGSDLVWIQCEPCDLCYPQDVPYFNPAKSSTYTNLSCDSKPCQDFQKSICINTNECGYTYSYTDGSYTIGALATDTFTFDSTSGQAAAFPNSVFGCGHKNGGLFGRRGSGLVGLGAGPLSLISQLGVQKFSYCLLPSHMNSYSKLKFGTDAVLSGPGVVSTPLEFDSSSPFYYLTLEGISAGGMYVAANMAKILIDSGTTLTLLEPKLYLQLYAAVVQNIGLIPIIDPQQVFQLCYDSSSFSSLPEMTMVFHFMGADVTLNALNLFRTLDDGVTCLAMRQAVGNNIFGNWAQINFQVEYDLGRKQVSFAPADCTQY